MCKLDQKECGLDALAKTLTSNMRVSHFLPSLGMLRREDRLEKTVSRSAKKTADQQFTDIRGEIIFLSLPRERSLLILAKNNATL